MRRFIPLSLIGTLFFAGIASSTTVIPPSFGALVSAAHTIFVGEVVNQQAIWVSTPQGRAIKTLVDFRVEDVWKGSSGVVTRLEFMGGTIGEMTMEVVGMPTFRLGQRSVLFVHGQRAISPLVGFMHGRLRIERDFAGVDRVRTHDGRSLGGINEMGTNRPSYMLSITPMRLADLASAVKSASGRLPAEALAKAGGRDE